MDSKKTKSVSLKQFLVYVVSASTVQITDIITEARALEGVVTISIFESTRKISETKNLTKIKLKYLEFSDNFSENIKKLKKSLSQINGVLSLILKIKKADILKKQDKSRGENDT